MLITSNDRGASRRRRGTKLTLVRGDREAKPTPTPRRPSLRSRVQEALERCGKRERLAIALILVERLNVAEAADALGMSPRDVDRVIHLTLARLRRVTPERSRSTCTSLRRAS